MQTIWQHYRRIEKTMQLGQVEFPIRQRTDDGTPTFGAQVNRQIIVLDCHSLLRMNVFFDFDERFIRVCYSVCFAAWKAAERSNKDLVRIGD